MRIMKWISMILTMLVTILGIGCASKKPIGTIYDVKTKSLDKTITLQWDANTEEDLNGYKAYYDIETKCPNNEDECLNPSGVYSNNIDIPLSSLSDTTNPEVTISGLDKPSG